MNRFSIEKGMLKNFKIHSIAAGILLIVIGLTGILLPPLLSLTISVFAGLLLIFGGLTSGYQVIKSYHKNWLAWLKPFILLVIGVLLLVYPISGAAVIGLLLAVYFLMDAFAGFSFAFEMHPMKSWGWMLFNGILSLIIAVLFLIGWPLNSLWLVGLFVGISLFIDGFVLLYMGIAAPKE